MDLEKYGTTVTNIKKKVIGCYGEFSKQFCNLYADICDACTKECEKTYWYDHCKQCTQSCRKCADECRRMAGTAT